MVFLEDVRRANRNILPLKTTRGNEGNLPPPMRGVGHGNYFVRLKPDDMEASRCRSTNKGSSREPGNGATRGVVTLQGYSGLLFVCIYLVTYLACLKTISYS
jgi:hypothetical protein